MKKKWIVLFLSTFVLSTQAQHIPIPLTYQSLYDFLDEMVLDGIIVNQSMVKPYYRNEVYSLLKQAKLKTDVLSPSQNKDLDFYYNAFSLEHDTIPSLTVQYSNKRTFSLSLFNPSFVFLSKYKKIKIAIEPILGARVLVSKKGAILERRWGGEMRLDMLKHISIWGSIRDISYNGTLLLKSSFFPSKNNKVEGAKLAMPTFLNNLPGCQYKEASYGADFSEVKGGITIYDWYASVGLIKDNIQWGDAYHCSNILSGRNPSIPQLTLQLTPCHWFRFDYFHAWLVSNVLDSANYYIENTTNGQTIKNYRPKNKYMAANMFTFLPCQYVHFAFGNAIIYAENNPQAAYFIPFAFYKSLDHLLTKGVATQNQNSQLFFSLSLFPVQHLKLYTSIFADDLKLARLKKSSKEHNPISYLIGFNWAGWPIKRLSLKGEFVRTFIATYNHSIDALTFTSNSYNLGHYMGDNAQSLFFELTYKPIKGMNIKLNFIYNIKYNAYQYLRTYRNEGEIIRSGNITEILSQKPFNKKIYSNTEIQLMLNYEFFPNMFAQLNIGYNTIRGRDNLVSSSPAELTGSAADYMDYYCPTFYQGSCLTTTLALYFNF